MFQRVRNFFGGRRAFRLGALAALGGAVGAFLGEAGWLYVERAANRALGPPVDVVFVVDVTPSMRPQLPALRRAIEKFAAETVGGGFDARFGLITFADHFLPGGAPKVHGQLTPQVEEFRRALSEMRIVRGGDGPESSLDALAAAARLRFRRETAAVVFLVTDAVPHVPDLEMKSLGDTGRLLASGGIAQLHLVTSRQALPSYTALRESARGEFFPLNEVLGGRRALERILPSIDNEAADPIENGLLSRFEYDGRSERALVLAMAIWVGLVAAGAALGLARRSSRDASARIDPVRDAPDIMAASRPGEKWRFARGFDARGGRAATKLAAGVFISAAVFGGAVQALHAWWLVWHIGVLPARVFSFLVQGIFIGIVLAWVLRSARLRRGGGVGVMAGAAMLLVFFGAGVVFSPLAARVMAGAAFGLVLGAGLARREVLGREVCLIVRWRADEELRLSLGEKPVIFGSSPAAQVHLPEEKGYPPVAATAVLRGGRVEIQNQIALTSQVLAEGERLQLGPVELELEVGRG